MPGTLLPDLCYLRGLESGESSWLYLYFCRALPPLLAYERLHELGGVQLGADASDVTQEIIRLVLRFLALIAGFANHVLGSEGASERPRDRASAQVSD